jgi:hypothetical protein
MEALAYLIKVNICWAVFYLFYRLLFRGHTFFILNRVYLVGSLVLALMIPVAKLGTKATGLPVTGIKNLEVKVQAAELVGRTSTATTFDWTVFIVGGYVLGVCVMLIILMNGLWKIYKRVCEGNCVPFGGCRIVVCNSIHPAGPFSFLRWMVISVQDFKDHFEPIYNHEIVHIRQWHSVDILLVEILKVFFWFNPALWLYKRSIAETHEFLADQHATDRDHYALFLVAYARRELAGSLFNEFSNKSLLNRRIQMLYKKRTNRWVLMRYALIVPLISLAVITMATRTSLRPAPREHLGSEFTSRADVGIQILQDTTKKPDIDSPKSASPMKRNHNGTKPAGYSVSSQPLALADRRPSYQKLETEPGDDSLLTALMAEMSAAMDLNDLDRADKLKGKISLQLWSESLRQKKQQIEIDLLASSPGDKLSEHWSPVSTLKNSVLQISRENLQNQSETLENIRLSFQQLASGLRQRLEEATRSKQAVVQEQIVADLLEEGLITSKQDLSFRLHNMFFIVNGVELSEATHQKFKSKYLKYSWTEWVYNWDGISGYRFTGVRFRG